MKALKIIGGIVVVLVVIFLLMGVFTPSVNYSNEIEVNKPLNESWAVFMDESKMGEWLPFIKSIELISGNDGEVGSQYTVIMDHEGKEMTMTEEITAIKENEQLAMKFTNDMMTHTLDIRFNEKDENTVINTDGVVMGNNIWWKSMFAISKSHFEKDDLMVLEGLKKVIESNTTDYFPEPEMEAMIVEGEEAAEGETSGEEDQ